MVGRPTDCSLLLCVAAHAPAHTSAHPCSTAAPCSRPAPAGCSRARPLTARAALLFPAPPLQQGVWRAGGAGRDRPCQGRQPARGAHGPGSCQEAGQGVCAPRRGGGRVGGWGLPALPCVCPTGGAARMAVPGGPHVCFRPGGASLKFREGTESGCCASVACVQPTCPAVEPCPALPAPPCPARPGASPHPHHLHHL